MVKPEFDHKYSAVRRIGIFIVDALVSFITFIAILFTIGTMLISFLAKNPVSILNEKFERVCSENQIAYVTDELYGLSQLDIDKIIEDGLKEGKSGDESYEAYSKLNNEVSLILSEDEEYQEAFASFFSIYMTIIVVSMCLALAIHQFAIPYFTKNHQTFAMIMFGATLVSSKDFKLITTRQITLRYFFMFFIEFTLFFTLLNIPGILMILVANILCVIITKERYTLHDLVVKTRMTYLFNVNTND